jgi:DHA1 family quinolone resistance protein-like MFS transporter/DHA1 family multidrug resistance protein-like MFS transporter
MLAKYQLKIVYVIIFLNFIAIGLVIPALPIIINDLKLHASAFGILISTFSFFQLAISPLKSVIFKGKSKKFILITAIALYVLSEFLFGIGNHFIVLMVSRALGGMSAGLIMAISLELVGELSDEVDKDKNFSTLSAITSLGFILGPGVGALFSTLYLRLPYFIAAFLGIIMLIIILLYYKQSDGKQYEQGNTERSQLKIWSFKWTLFPVIIVFVLSFGLSSIEELYPLYLVDVAQFESIHIAIAIISGSLVGVIVQYFLYPIISSKFSTITIMLLSSIFSIIVLCILLNLKSIISLILISSIIFIGFDMLRPAVAIYLSNLYKDNQSLAGSLNSTFTALGNLLAPIAGGYAYESNIQSPIFIALGTIGFGIISIIINNKYSKTE